MKKLRVFYEVCLSGCHTQKNRVVFQVGGVGRTLAFRCQKTVAPPNVQRNSPAKGAPRSAGVTTG